MPHRLVIRMFFDGACEWLALDRAGKLVDGPASGLPEASAERIDLLLPAEYVLLLDAPRLAKRSSQLAQALPYAIEEQLAGPVEQQHVAFDERAAGVSVPVAVIERARMRELLATLSGKGHSVDRCFSIAQLLPFTPMQLTILIDGEASLLRWSASSTMSCRTAELSDSLQLLRDSGVAWERMRVWRVHGSPLPSLGGDVVDEVRIPAALPWLAELVASATAPDLLQGEFLPRRRGGRVSAQWRWAAVLAGVALLAGLLNLTVERFALERHSDLRRAEMDALLRQAIPGTQRVVDPVAQLSAELDRRAGTRVGGALPLLARLAPLIAGSGRYTIESLDYRAGALELTITATDVAALDGLRATLSAAQLQVDLTSALPGSNGYEGRLRIKDSAS